MQKDPYEVLGVSKNASETDIRSAYRKKAKELHPDRHPAHKKNELEDQLKEVNQAYDILKDPQKKSTYDQFGHGGFQGGNGGFQGGFDFSDIFNEFFGGGFQGSRRASQQSRGEDRYTQVYIQLEDAYKGKKVKVKYAALHSCDECSGTGGKTGSSPVTCSTCRGQGKVRAQNGIFIVEQACPTCNGKGKTIQNPCRKCSGKGTQPKDTEYEFDIPKGIPNGTRIRISGKGDLGSNNGTHGDLYVEIFIKPHEFFRWEEGSTDLYCQIPISFVQASLGDKIEIPTIDSKMAKIDIPKGTQTSTKFKLSGKGMPMLRQDSKLGNLIVEMKIEVPVNLSQKQIELLKAFEEETNNNKNHPQSNGFFAKIKNMFS